MSKILVADDEPEVVDFCAFALKELKHAVVTVDNGSDVLSKLKSEKPDLLILDLMLPGVDGYTLQLQMSSDEKLTSIPVIIITALKPAKELFGQFSRVKAFLHKPFDAHALQDAVKKALGGASHGRR